MTTNIQDILIFETNNDHGEVVITLTNASVQMVDEVKTAYLEDLGWTLKSHHNVPIDITRRFDRRSFWIGALVTFGVQVILTTAEWLYVIHLSSPH